MIYQVSHTTIYDYREPVSLSRHILRLRPRQHAHQNAMAHEVSINPLPTSTVTHIDYFGNAVSVIEIERPHTRLVFRSNNKVRTTPVSPIDALETPGWEQVRDLSRGCQHGHALEASEFLYDSPLIKAEDEFGDYAAVSFSKSRPVLDAVLHLTERIHEDFTFDQDATTVGTPVQSVLKKRRGVCQDFAHLQIACLRSLGLPARYVSGYVETFPPPGREKMVGSDASHAWVSFYCHSFGWIDVDPTNNLLVSDQHITLGWGRDYSDVSPVRGVILGSGHHTVNVAVDVQAIPGEESSSGMRESQ